MIPLARPFLGQEEEDAALRVMRSGHIAAGPEVAAFESEFAKYMGTKHAVMVTSGTAALTLALKAIDVGPGDEVICPSFTFNATPAAIAVLGAVPVFADIDPKTYNIDVSHAKSLITSRTAAIVPVHLYGLMADMGELKQLRKPLIEDAAQAHGAGGPAGRPGALSEAAIFSFYATKNMTTGGEGGMVVTNYDDVAQSVRAQRNHGGMVEYRHQEVGLNFSPTDISAAIGREQLRKLPRFQELREDNARRHSFHLDGVAEGPERPYGYQHGWHQYTIRVQDREAVVESLRRSGIGTGVFYPVPQHMQPSFPWTPEPLPHTELAAQEVLSLPIRPDLSLDEVYQVAQAVRSALWTSASSVTAEWGASTEQPSAST